MVIEAELPRAMSYSSGVVDVVNLDVGVVLCSTTMPGVHSRNFRRKMLVSYILNNLNLLIQAKYVWKVQ